MAAYATVSELEARWRTLSAAEKVRAGTLLDDASLRVDVECPPDDPVTDAAAREIVVCEMVKRAMSVGADAVGVTSTQVGAGPYQETRNFANPTGDLYLTKTDKRLLKCGGAVAFTVPMTNDAEFVPPWGVL